jgi:3-isopropylmalate dehydrogenase
VRRPYPIGLLEGEGIGPAIVGAARDVLAALDPRGRRFAIRRADVQPAELSGGLGPALADFCADLFSAGGALLAGPVGGRFVYELRRRFDLYCKLVPLRPRAPLVRAGRLKPEHVAGVDVVVVRENVAGAYQGESRDIRTPHERRAEHEFSYTEAAVQRIVRAAASLAVARRGALAVVVKDGGLPAVSELWRDTATAIAAGAGVAVRFLNVDLAAYLLVQHPHDLDVVVAPNLFGDVLADVGAVLLGGRGVSFSGNFGADGAAVYQTNHGAAWDLVGTDRANPAGQLLALAMLLRESFGLVADAICLEAALDDAWAQGWRTPDLAEPGCRVVGTREFARVVTESVARRAADLRWNEDLAPTG